MFGKKRRIRGKSVTDFLKDGVQIINNKGKKGLMYKVPRSKELFSWLISGSLVYTNHNVELEKGDEVYLLRKDEEGYKFIHLLITFPEENRCIAILEEKINDYKQNSLPEKYASFLEDYKSFVEAKY